MHLAVYGGTFDPPHNGHLALCLFARELLAIDRLIISVSNNPFKQNRAADDVNRKRMAELLSSEINLTDSGCCEVSGWELEKQKPSYTVDLIRYFHARYPYDQLTLLVGEDSFWEFSSWKEYEKLFLLCGVVVFRRSLTEKSRLPGLPPDNLHLEEAIRFIDFAYQVSSTEVRELESAGKSIARFVPASVHRYITRHSLYR